MPAPRSSRIMVTFLVVWLPACATWSAVQGPPGDYVARESPDRVQVERTDGTVVELAAPEVRGDSLAGKHHPRRGGITSDVAVPLERVRELRTRRIDAAATATAVLIPVNLLWWAVIFPSTIRW